MAETAETMPLTYGSALDGCGMERGEVEERPQSIEGFRAFGLKVVWGFGFRAA